MALEIRLSSFSTGQPHPLAERPIIFITSERLPLEHCNVLIEIVGDFLALLITFPWERYEHEEIFFLVRWKKGETYYVSDITTHSSPIACIVTSYAQFPSSEWRAYACFNFLSEDTLVISNLIQNTLDIVKIVIQSNDIPCLAHLCALNLPSLTRHASVVCLGCRAEPNPIGSGPLAIPAPSNRPFRDKVEDAIIMFSVLTEDLQIHPGQPNFVETRSFAFVVHRRALLDHIPAAHRACAPFCSIPASEPPPEAVRLPWEAWGTSATRWFEGNPAPMRWITTTAGQRAVMTKDGASTPIIVRDFNTYAVRSARTRAAASGHLQQHCDWSEELPNGNHMVLKVDDNVIAAGSVFKDDVRSSLPYVEIVTRADYRYGGILIDEERILGLKVCAC